MKYLISIALVTVGCLNLNQLSISARRHVRNGTTCGCCGCKIQAQAIPTVRTTSVFPLVSVEEQSVAPGDASSWIRRPPA